MSGRTNWDELDASRIEGTQAYRERERRERIKSQKEAVLRIIDDLGGENPYKDQLKAAVEAEVKRIMNAADGDGKISSKEIAARVIESLSGEPAYDQVLEKLARKAAMRARPQSLEPSEETPQ